MLLKLMTVGTIGEASLIRDGLLFEGIEVELRGEHRASIAGELPLGESEVELWVRAADGTRALALIAATRSVDASESVRCEKCLETARKKTGEKVSEVCDLNRDGMFEIHRRYAPAGWLQTEIVDFDNSGDPERFLTYGPRGPMSEMFDHDENGIVERTLVFGLDGKTVVEEFVDRDQDGRPEKSIETRPNGLTVTWLDVNQDGNFEKREVSSNGVLIFTEVDLGHAGFAKIAPR